MLKKWVKADMLSVKKENGNMGSGCGGQALKTVPANTPHASR